MANGLTDAGFDINSLAQNIKELEKAFQNAYNNPRLTVEDNEYFGQIMKVWSDRETKIWQAIQQVYNGWTVNGAEGVYLDEIFALQGIFREGATAGIGEAVVQTDHTARDDTEISIGTTFSGENGVQYITKELQVVGSKVVAYRLMSATLKLGTYNFEITNNSTAETKSQSFTLASNKPDALSNFLKSLKLFLDSISENSAIIEDDNLYFGFNSALELEGSVDNYIWRISPSCGNRYSLIECEATTLGFKPLLIGQITGMSPTPDGYVSVTNLARFSDGSEVETDPEFINRASQEVDSPRGCTEPAITAGLLKNVVGVKQVTFSKVGVDGVLTVFPVIIGGDTKAIAEELYRTQPIGNQYGGKVAYEVTTADGEKEIIRFDRGRIQPLSVRVKYKTVQNSALSTDEKEVVYQNIINASSSWSLGAKVFNYQLMAAVSDATPYSRFANLIVETKRKEDPDTSYTTEDFMPEIDQLPTVERADIDIQRLL